VDASTHPVLNAADCGCPATDVVALPFTITATRIPRLGLYGSLGLGNATVKLLSPYDLHKYFTVEVNGSVTILISACQLNASSCQRAGAASYFDFYVSDVIPYPQVNLKCTKRTCFTSTKVQILTLAAARHTAAG
jgi:hypothetical protein